MLCPLAPWASHAPPELTPRQALARAQHRVVDAAPSRRCFVKNVIHAKMSGIPLGSTSCGAGMLVQQVKPPPCRSPASLPVQLPAAGSQRPRSSAPAACGRPQLESWHLTVASPGCCGHLGREPAEYILFLCGLCVREYTCSFCDSFLSERFSIKLTFRKS